MSDIITDTETGAPKGDSSQASCSAWHVWEVCGHFYAAATLESAKECHSGEWGVPLDELTWSETPCDNHDYYEDPEEDDCPVTYMRSQAEWLMKKGQVMPFQFAVEI